MLMKFSWIFVYECFDICKTRTLLCSDRSILHNRKIYIKTMKLQLIKLVVQNSTILPILVKFYRRAVVDCLITNRVKI